MSLTINFYEEKGAYCAYIGSENSSGYVCNGNTPEECLQNVKEHLTDITDELFDE